MHFNRLWLQNRIVNNDKKMCPQTDFKYQAVPGSKKGMKEKIIIF